MRDFFSALVSQHLNKASPGARLDFLACNLMLHTDGGGLDKELEAFVGVSIPITRQCNILQFLTAVKTVIFRWNFFNYSYFCFFFVGTH